MFHSMPRVMGDKEMVKSALGAARKTTPPKEKNNRPRLIRLVEAKKIFTFSITATSHLHEITSKTPRLDELSEFHSALLSTIIDAGHFKKSLGAVLWAEKELRRLERDHKALVWDLPLKDVGGVKKKFFGRAASVLKQISKDLEFLERSRKALFKTPEIKDIPTFVLAGMPNVGKSSLLKALTGASPDIQPYPFTTKGLLLGYIDEQVQMIDTPGLLERPLKERNKIELQAILAITHAADGVIFIYDPTDFSGYSHEDQKALMRELENAFSGVPFIACITKCDLATPEEISAAKENLAGKTVFETSAETNAGIDEMKKYLKKKARSTESETGESLRTHPPHVPAREIKQR